MNTKQKARLFLEHAGVTDLHGAVFVLTKGLSEPLPVFIEQALTELFDIPREFILFAIGELVMDVYQVTPAEIERALKVARESA